MNQKGSKASKASKARRRDDGQKYPAVIAKKSKTKKVTLLPAKSQPTIEIKTERPRKGGNGNK